jgi:hypothetical protein
MNKISSRSEFEIFTLILTILLYLSRTAIPILKIPFVLLFFSLITYSVFILKKQIFQKLAAFLSIYCLLIILSVILTISFILSDKLYLTIFKDVCNSAILLSFGFLLSVFITSKKDLNYFMLTFINLTIFFAFFISISALTSLFNVFSFNEGMSSNGLPVELTNEYIPIDKNFSMLIVFFGMICLVLLSAKPLTTLQSFFINILLVLCSIDILFSGSRRGVFVLIILVIILIGLQFYSIFKKKNYIKLICSNTRFYLICLIILILSCYCFTFETSYAFKNKTLRFIGSKNLLATKHKIALKGYWYYSAFSQTKTYPDIYNILWTPGFDPLDPDSGWGTRIHKTITHLTGYNVEIVPRGTKGYCMDKTCNADTWEGNAYSYTTVFNKNVNKNDTLSASVFCFVSSDFDGTWALLDYVGSSDGEKIDKYDLNFKGTWQKLSIKASCSGGNAPLYLYFSKYGYTDFKSLKGYVIFTDPQITIIPKRDSTLSGSGKINLNKSMPQQSSILFRPWCSNPLLVENNQLPRDGRLIVRNVHLLEEKSLVFRDYVIPSILRHNDFFKTSCFDVNIKMIKNVFQHNLDHDFIRKWASRFISEDTTYHDLSHLSVKDTISDSFLENRLNRWHFAWEIYTKEFNLSQKIIGGGFNFLNWYGNRYSNDKTLSDSPHNPFLSILLYSGAIGFILYLVLLFSVLFYYLKYLKEHYIFFIFFLITFIFSFFSGCSPFDPPIMGFFMLLPFFIHSIHKTLVKQQSKN